MQNIYKIRKKYLYKDKVQLAMPRCKENLLISKDGLHYIESNTIPFTNYKAPNDFYLPLCNKSITQDYYLGLLSLNTPIIRIFSTEQIKESIEQSMREYTVAEKILYRTHVDNYLIYVEGVYINDDDPLIGSKGDIIGITRSLNHLSSKTHKIELSDTKKILEFLNTLLSECDERYIISSKNGILSAEVDGKELINSGIDVEKYILEYIKTLESLYKTDINTQHSMYFVRVEREKTMTIVLVNFKKDCLKFTTFDLNKVFLSNERKEFPSYFGKGTTTFKSGIYDLMTFDNDELEYNEDIKESPIKKLFKRKK